MHKNPIKLKPNKYSGKNKKSILDKNFDERCGIDLSDINYNDYATKKDIARMLDKHLRIDHLHLKSYSEPEVYSNFTKLSQKNFCIDTNPYPLGSCTMKYNPKINEWAARLDGFTSMHPYLPEKNIQGGLSIMFDMQNWLSEIGGFHQTSLQPSAGAQAEFLGILIILSALKYRGENRKKILIPESAHGTNPATAAFFNLKVINIKSNKSGLIDIDDIKNKMDYDTVGIMITNPNTLGFFEKDIVKITNIIHKFGGFVYGDGANLNAIMGIVKPGKLGIDAMHFNLHKTFSTPHGGGGPGAGALGVSRELDKFLPTPIISIDKKKKNYFFDYNRKLSVGKIRSFYGNFGVIIRAWTYIREMGRNGLKKSSELAVLNANYIKYKLKKEFHLPYDYDCLHEVVFTDKKQQENNISALNIAKRLIDYGIHPPTIYFPLIVSGALMIEPTETESKESLDNICKIFLKIAKESQSEPEVVKLAPRNTSLSILDEVKSARNPILKSTLKDK